MSSLPQVPSGEENFYYASQTSIWAFYRVDLTKLQEMYGAKMKTLGLSIATFKDDPCGYVAVNPMFYTAVFGKQRTAEDWPGLAGISEAEFNLLVYPTKEEAKLPELTFKEFLLGWEQQKIIGQYRLAVICNHMGAVMGGRNKYGEHKFLGDIDFDIPVPNCNQTTPSPFEFSFTASLWGGAGDPNQMVFSIKGSVEGLHPIAADASPVIVYGALPPEPAAGVEQQAIGSRRNHLGLFQAYFVDQKNGSASLEYGDCQAGPILRDFENQPVPHSEAFPKDMRLMMQDTLTSADLVAFLLFQAPPVETEPRPYYI